MATQSPTISPFAILLPFVAVIFSSPASARAQSSLASSAWISTVSTVSCYRRKSSSDWPHFGDVLGETDLKPLPDSLARLDDTPQHNPPSLFCDTSSATVPSCQCNACSESLEKMELDDIDLDSFAWSCNLSSDAVDARLDPLPLPACDLPFGAFEASGEGGDVPGASTWDGRKMSEKRGCGRASRLNGLGFDEIKNYF
ncbi:hypothetical protein MUK42_31011 [Musa troglodytarum]|uniref:Uncharacterized protein n=1 Tax=Musa troglodytarum TaxID=320322 RepID=A0A9E7FI58_9LILI|nr:hypothetical protein MUK42_31011 [Musa troglodytarum]